MIAEQNSGSMDSIIDDLISDSVRFWVFLIFLISSLSCSIFVLYHLFLYGKLQRHLFNHAVIIVLVIGLIYEVTIYPWMLYFYHQNGDWSRSLIFCTIWSFIDWGLYYTQTILFAWATIERHILIFHDRWVATSRCRFFIHYFPLIILTTYCLIYYIIIDFFPPCENEYLNASMICVKLCITKIHALYMWDMIVHQLLPNLIIIIFSLALLVRVCWHKRSIGQSLTWKKHRRMTVQLLSISILFLTCAFPITLLNVLHFYSPMEPIQTYLFEYFLFLNYTLILLLPFACLLSAPQVQEHLRNRFYFGNRRCRIIVPNTSNNYCR